jgi:hypothetical protein
LLSNSGASFSLASIENTILRAYSNVCRLVVDLNMYRQDQLLPLEKMSKLANLQLMKLRIVDYSWPDKYDPDFDSGSNDESSEEDEESFDDDDGDNPSDNLAKVSFSPFQGMRVFDSINSTLSNEGTTRGVKKLFGRGYDG